VKQCLLFICVLLSACSRVDNFFLGEDNTDPPTKLTEIHEKVTVESQWKVKTGYGKHNEYVTLQPAIANDRIITADIQGNVIAVDRTTGKNIWRALLEQGVSSGPVLRNQVVVLGTRKGKVIALSSMNGKALWTAEVSNEVLARPVLVGNKALIQTTDGKLYAFNLADGKLLWRYEHNNPSMILRSGGSPVVTHDKVIAGFADGRLVAVNLNNGELLWVRTVAQPEGGTDVQRMVDIAATPVVANGVLYVASFQGQLAAINLSSGNLIWHHKVSVYNDLAMDGNVIYASDSHSQLWAFNRVTGKVLWRQNDLKGRNITAPVVNNDKLIIADGSGYIHVLSKKNGQFLGRKKITLLSGISAAPQVSQDHIYVLLNNGELEHLTLQAIPTQVIKKS